VVLGQGVKWPLKIKTAIPDPSPIKTMVPPGIKKAPWKTIGDIIIDCPQCRTKEYAKFDYKGGKINGDKD
jgi:hypothetical protein